MLSSPSPNRDLITLLASSRNGILKSGRNYLISTSEVICLTDHCHPLEENDLATTNPLFASIISFSPLPSAYGSLSFSTPF